MISNALLNVMSADELRNYAKHVSNLIDCVNELLYAKNELNDSLQKCVNNVRYEADRDRDFKNRYTNLLELEDALLKEHYNELPHLIPTCDCSDGERKE